MSRRRKYGEDLTYAEEHRLALPELYRRIGHRLDMANRDWTEFCHWCKDPLALFEEFQDDGRDFRDKATTVTRKLAESSGVPAALFAWQTQRTRETQQQIDELWRELFELYAANPIIGFRARLLWPEPGPVVSLEPAQWWLWVAAVHRDHHRFCARARDWAPEVHLGRLQAAVDLHPLRGSRALPRLEVFAEMPLIALRGAS